MKVPLVIVDGYIRLVYLITISTFGLRVTGAVTWGPPFSPRVISGPRLKSHRPSLIVVPPGQSLPIPRPRPRTPSYTPVPPRSSVVELPVQGRLPQMSMNESRTGPPSKPDKVSPILMVRTKSPAMFKFYVRGEVPVIPSFSNSIFVVFDRPHFRLLSYINHLLFFC